MCKLKIRCIIHANAVYCSLEEEALQGWLCLLLGYIHMRIMIRQDAAFFLFFARPIRWRSFRLMQLGGGRPWMYAWHLFDWASESFRWEAEKKKEMRRE